MGVGEEGRKAGIEKCTDLSAGSPAQGSAPEPESVISVWGRSDLRDGDMERASGGAVRSLPP